MDVLGFATQSHCPICGDIYCNHIGFINQDALSLDIYNQLQQNTPTAAKQTSLTEMLKDFLG